MTYQIARISLTLSMLEGHFWCYVDKMRRSAPLHVQSFF